MFRSSIPFLVVFLSGCVVTIAAQYFLNSSNGSIRALRESDIASSSVYTFTDPLIGTTGGPDVSPDYVGLQMQLSGYISAQQKNGLLSTSVNVRDIYASTGMVINPDEQYDPASLTKVPLAMVYYELSQQDPSVLSEQVLYSGEKDLDADEQIKSGVQLEQGHSYSVETLIEHMIKYSDNNAEQLLADHLSTTGRIGKLTSLFGDLGFKFNPAKSDYMKVRSYSIFLRVLFNSTYLDRANSEKMLKLLTQADFSGGIDAGVPNNILVAQKFGDARIPDAAGTIIGAELHNCGIVYYPAHPYILCIMTKGSDLGDLKATIAAISAQVFQYMEKKYPLGAAE